MIHLRWLPASIGLVVLTATALRFNFPHLAPGASNWAEPGNIATAIVEGRGFSDPFAGGTGPTAWMPPVYPLLVAAVFSVAGVKTAAAATAMLVLSVLGLAAAHAFLLAALPVGDRWLRYGASGAFLGLVCVLPGEFLEVQSEAWLAVLCSTLVLWGTVEHERSGSRAATMALALGSTFGALTHAGLLLGAGAVLLVLGWRDLRLHRLPWASLIALSALLLGCSAWTVRNRLALGRWVPIKSNLWFELHLTTVVSPDGLLRASDTLPHHPFFSPAEFARYASLGEIAYVDSFRAPALAAVRAHPAEFVRRVANRFGSAFGAIAADESVALTKHGFSADDQAQLGSAGLLLLLPSDVGSLWLALDAAPDEVLQRMAVLRLREPAADYRDWLDHRREAAVRRASGTGRLSRLLLAGLPVFALGCAAIIARRQIAPVLLWAALLHFATLAPFVLVNHGARQQFPQTALHALFLASLPAAIANRRRLTGAIF